MRFSRRSVSGVLIAACLAVAGCEKEQAVVLAERNSEPLTVTTMELSSRDWQLNFVNYGHFESTEKVTVSVDFSGTVEKVHFREGQSIAAGELLIELDDSKQRLRLQQAQANLESARAELEKTSATHSRHRDLAATGALSREQLKQSESAFERARAQAEEAEAALALARQNMRETRIISPVDGVVDRRSVEPGQTVLPGDPLAVVQVADTLRVVTYVSEKEVNQLRVGDIAEVSTPAVPGRRYEARIELVSSTADPATGNFTVKLTVNNRDRQLRPGMSAAVQLQGLKRADVLVLPKNLMVDRDRRRVVFVYDNGIAREVEPVLGVSASDELPVLAGLQPGDRVITSNLDLLVDGRSVRLEIAQQDRAQ